MEEHPESVTRSNYYELEEIPSAINWLNNRSSKEKQLTDPMSYMRHRYKDEKLPQWLVVASAFMKKNGTAKGLNSFVFHVEALDIDQIGNKLCSRAFTVH